MQIEFVIDAMALLKAEKPNRRPRAWYAGTRACAAKYGGTLYVRLAKAVL